MKISLSADEAKGLLEDGLLEAHGINYDADRISSKFEKYSDDGFFVLEILPIKSDKEGYTVENDD